MKTKKFPVLLGTLIIGMAFGLLLAGCPGAGTGTGSGGMENPSAAVQAAQLAADINTIKPGIAKVNGTTITLTGRLTLKTNLTVPQGVTLDVTADSSSIKAEGAKVNDTTVTLTDGLTPKTDLTMSQGVTLDLTADGAVLGLHDMILTVNGTVNAKSNRIGLEDTAAYGIINGSGTIHLKGKGRLLEVGGNKNVADRTLTLDGVTLVGVTDNDEPLVVVRSGGEGRSGEFIMKSGAITGNTHIGGEFGEGGGVRVEEGGTFTMQDGEISGNTAEGERAHGGGVQVDSKSVFTMSGGTISGNTAEGERAHGGGVRVEEGGRFTMQGGTISENTAEGGDYAEGGGVSIHKGTFTMESGTISRNTVTSDEFARGGGVRVGGDVTFTMTGGAITGNTCVASEDFSSGGGVEVWEGTFTMQGGAISGNSSHSTADGHSGGGGVTVGSDTGTGTFTMEGGSISGNSANEGGGVSVYKSLFTLKGGRIQGSADSDGFTKNTASSHTAALWVDAGSMAKWGIGGTYTKGGVSQTGGNNIGYTDDTLIAAP